MIVGKSSHDNIEKARAFGLENIREERNRFAHSDPWVTVDETPGEP